MCQQENNSALYSFYTDDNHFWREERLTAENRGNMKLSIKFTVPCNTLQMLQCDVKCAATPQ